jgi:TRAP-type C4-dicarboxylate transport system permease small subunit
MRTLLAAYDALIDGLAAAAALTIAAVCLLIAWDVIARNLGFRPPDSTIALTEYALLYVTMAVAPALVRRRGHVVIEVLHERVPAAPRAHLDRVILAFCAVVSLAVASMAALLAVEGAARGELDVRSLDLPRTWLFVPLAVGFLLTGTEFLRLLVRGENLARPATGRSSL